MHLPDVSRSASNPSRRKLLGVGASLAAALLWIRRDGVAATESVPAGPLAEREFERAARRAELCSTSNAVGTGLRGEYFAGELGRGDPLLVRTDATIDFDRSLEWPVQGGLRQPASARWTGWVKPPISGRYRFHADQPAARLVVARQVMVGEGAGADASIELASGRFYPVTLEMKRLGGMQDRLRLEWTAPHGARYLVPRALLFMPTETVPVAKR